MKCFSSLVLFAMLLTANGCAGSARSTPTLNFGVINMQSNLSRQDIIVMDRVDGTSESTIMLGGLIEMIDGDKLVVLGIPFFKDRFAVYEDKVAPSPYTRAYYAALQKTPEADAVLQKSVVSEVSGFPLIYGTQSVTISGKAIKLKAN